MNGFLTRCEELSLGQLRRFLVRGEDLDQLRQDWLDAILHGNQEGLDSDPKNNWQLFVENSRI